jgi:hypothetical protein
MRMATMMLHLRAQRQLKGCDEALLAVVAINGLDAPDQPYTLRVGCTQLVIGGRLLEIPLQQSIH